VQGLNLLDDLKTTIVSAGIDRVVQHGVIDLDAESTAAEQYRQLLHVRATSVDVNVNTLSGGNQQKTVLAKWMFTEPSLAILDEPTRGIDVGAKYEIYGLIDQLADQGKGVIMISSELPELLGVCDRIYTVFEGRITSMTNAADATQESLMRQMTDTAGSTAMPCSTTDNPGDPS